MNKLRTKIRTKLLLLIIITGLASSLLFQGMWNCRWKVWDVLSDAGFFDDILPSADDNFWNNLFNKAADYDLPASETDSKAIDALTPFFDETADEYTSIYLYSLTEGEYLVGRYAQVMDSENFRVPFDITYRWTDGANEERFEMPVKFKNGYATVLVYFYHQTYFITPYFFVCLICCLTLFLGSILFFVRRKMKEVDRLEQHILTMASGDLITPVIPGSKDELGILARELDNLRITLHETITDEQESHQANQDLITAMSHDLRTPLTVLRGYLEILRLGKNADMQTEYLNRCIQKTEDIQEMSDRMFEYALVYEKNIQPELRRLTSAFLLEHLMENADFLHLTGFQASPQIPDEPFPDFEGDPALIKRIFNNLFSNILKYGDKKTPVAITFCQKTGSHNVPQLIITLENAVKSDLAGIESNRIGLKSAEKMMQLMHGQLNYTQSSNFFTSTLTFKGLTD